MSEKKYALITGATGGIGLEIARELAQKNYNLIMVGRSVEKIANFASDYPNIDVKIVKADLSQTEGIKSLTDATDGLSIEVLVNNAGFGDSGAFVATHSDRNTEMIRLNIEALTTLTRFYLPQMVKQKYGYLMNVASTAAFQPGPFMAVYFATKAYVLSFSEALSVELKGTGVSVTALCPGATQSGFQSAANLGDVMLFRMGIPTSAQVAKFAVKAMFKKRIVAVHGFANILLALTGGWSPIRRRIAALVTPAMVKAIH